MPFQSTRPVRGATKRLYTIEGDMFVSIHTPRAGRDLFDLLRRSISVVSIHAPRAGRDPVGMYSERVTMVSIHAPRAGRDCDGAPRRMTQTLFQSTRPVRGATSCQDYLLHPTPVSIHAPRAGRDADVLFQSHAVACFNPRAPCGARLISSGVVLQAHMFQSTRPVRGAT